MRTKKLKTRAAAALLAIFLLLALCPAAVFAAEGEVRIGSLEDLRAFAGACASDSYSAGLRVILTADIDAEGEDISVPVFLGSFDGRGYRIYGLRITRSASDLGLFSRIGAGASVKNLRVEGEVIPGGSQSRVGGIAGENLGTIENCSFSGVVSAAEKVGGVAGSNGESGLISGCTVSGVVRGTESTGGVVGFSTGTLLKCASHASVNTTVSEEDLLAAELEDLESTVVALLTQQESTGSENPVTDDTGGVCGYSTGIMQGCTNYGSVGYPHVGYNVGGVVGRQNGYMAACTNYGAVQGRKDVGGVVGQMAPDITLMLSADGLAELQTELNRLDELLDRTLDDAQGANDTVSARITELSAYADSARESAYDLNGQLSDFADANIASVNALSLMIDRYVDKAVPIADAVSAGAEELAEFVSRTREMLDELDGIDVYNDVILSELASMCASLESAGKKMEQGADELEAAFELMQNDIELPDTTQLRADLKVLLAAQEELNAALTAAMDEYEQTGTVSKETRDEVERTLRLTLDAFSDVVRDLNDIAEDPDFDGMLDRDLETLKKIAEHLKNASGDFSDAAKDLTAAVGALRRALDAMREVNRMLGDAADELDGVLESAENAAKDFADALKKADEWAHDLAEEKPITFTPLGDEYDASSNALNAALTGLSGSLESLNGELSGSATTLIADLREVNSQFMAVMNCFLRLLGEARDIDYEDMFEDVSEEDIKNAARGKVLECVNHGSVTADRNVGGVAGAMATEYDLDPEDDLLPDSGGASNYTYQTRAILIDCANYGAVTAKYSAAGSVAGRMDLGIIYNCGGYGDTASESGDYVGGVCGQSLSAIRASWAKCTLSGGKYVGGISGSGARVTDCAAMVEIAASTQLAGAIAGEITDDYSGNRFVSDTGLAGVDRVSYAGRAESVAYAALVADESVPDEFRTLTLSFLADGKTLSETAFRYGQSFGGDAYPAVPEKEDCYVRWDREELQDLRFDTRVEAVYEPYVTALAAGDTADGRPALLVEGSFRRGDALSLSDQSDAPDHGEVLESWTLRIPDDGAASHTVRVYLPETKRRETLSVWTRSGALWQKRSGDEVGRCLVFGLEGDADLAITAARRSLWPFCAAGAACFVALVAVLLLVRKKRRRKKRA